MPYLGSRELPHVFQTDPVQGPKRTRRTCTEGALSRRFTVAPGNPDSLQWIAGTSAGRRFHALIREPCGRVLQTDQGPSILLVFQDFRRAGNGSQRLLLVASRREPRAIAKAEKDRMQALLILEFLQRARQGDILLAAEDLCGRGTSWVKRLREGVKKLPRPIQELDEVLRNA